jgi:RNA polymerase sigma-70 factor (ECF subfamily)
MLNVAVEEQLPVAAARAGDGDAWAALFRRYQLPIYVFALELVQQHHVALDIVQETFINATRYIGSLRQNAQFGSWLFSIAHQKCVQHWRKPRRDEVAPDENEAELCADDSPSDLMIRREDEEQFMHLLQRLTEPHRAVLLLHFLEDFSLEEIAGITGVSTGTVKSRMHFAKRHLRKLLEAAA